jgi:STE24 endopeptidase
METRTVMAVDPDRQAQAAAYARARYSLIAASGIVTALYVVAWLISGLSRDLDAALLAWISPKPVRVAAYLVIVGLGYALITLPLDYLGHLLSRRYALSVQSTLEWLQDLFKAGLLSAAFGLSVGEVLYLLLEQAPRVWWLWSSALLFLLDVLLATFAPLIVVPLFFDVRPLADPVLVERLTRLAERSGAHVRGVFTVDFSRRTTTANAALVGLGNTQRIILADTLLSAHTPDEVEVVLAHELAHHVHGDVWKGLCLSAVVLLTGLWLTAQLLAWAVTRWGFDGVGDLAAFPLLALSLGGFYVLTSPLTNAYSRWREGLADRYALRLTGNSAAFVSSMAKLADENLSQLEPPRWAVWLLFGHPPIGERIRLGQRWERESGLA